MQPIYNPANAMIESSGQMIDHLSEAARDFELAMERRALTLQSWQDAKSAYDEAEVCFLFDATFMMGSAFEKAKNAEMRELVKDNLLIKARNNGDLCQSWRILNAATAAKEEAQLAYYQCELRYKAVRAACELQAARMISVAKG